MSNRIALTSLCFFIGLTVFAQNGSKWRIGFKAGWNYSDQRMSGSPEGTDKIFNQSTDWLSGVHAGFRSELLLKESIALNADLLYNQRGFKTDLRYPTGATSPISFNAHYLSLPLTAGFKLIDQLWVEAGGEISAWLDQTALLNGEKISLFDDSKYAATDVGLIGGLSYQFGKWIKLSGRYYRGLGNVQDVTFTDANGQPIKDKANLNYHGVQLSLTVFPF